MTLQVEKVFTLEGGKEMHDLKQTMKDIFLQKHSLLAISGESLWELGDDV